jgi:hypothetical protein
MFYSPYISQFPAVRIPGRKLDVACCIVTTCTLHFPDVPVYDMDKEKDSAVQRHGSMIN